MERKAKLALLTAAAAALLTASAAISVPKYQFTQAGNYPGAALTNPNGANLGQIVGYYYQTGLGTFGYVQTGDSFVTAQPTGSADSYLWSINANGLAVGGFCQGSNCTGAPFAAHGYTYDSATGGTTTIDYPGATTTAAYGISDSGVVVGGWCVQGFSACPTNLFYVASHGFIDDNGAFTQLDYPGSDGTTAFGVNSGGTVVGTYSTFGSNGVIHGFLYGNGTYTDLNFPGANWTEALGINDGGMVVGSYQDAEGFVFGFMYYSGQWAQINARSGGATSIIGINDHNDLVGTWSGFNGPHPIKGVPARTTPTLTSETK